MSGDIWVHVSLSVCHRPKIAKGSTATSARGLEISGFGSDRRLTSWSAGHAVTGGHNTEELTSHCQMWPVMSGALPPPLPWSIHPTSHIHFPRAWPGILCLRMACSLNHIIGTEVDLKITNFIWENRISLSVWEFEIFCRMEEHTLQ
jgi:hypothetical protein